MNIGTGQQLVSQGNLTNFGSISLLNGGSVDVFFTLTNNATITLSGGAVEAADVTNYYVASFSGNGTVTGNFLNQGSFTPSGILSVSGSFTNAGTATIAAGSQLLPTNVTNSGALYLNGGAISNAVTFTNSGTVNLNGGAIVGGGNFTNAASGIIRGDGTITMPLTNSGGIISANGGNGLTLTNFAGNFGGGELLVADGDSLTAFSANGGTSFWNMGMITLEGPNAALNGATIYNNDTISGQGNVTSGIENFATITAVGGQLVLAGLYLSEPSSAIRSAAGTSIVVLQGMGTNTGLIALTGGSFDNNGNAMTNYGSMLGNGIISTGGLSNYHIISLAGGNTGIFGAVYNNSGGTITTQGTSSTIVTFYGPVTNYPGGYISSTGNTIYWLGGFTNNASYITDPAANYFTGLTNGPSGVLQGGAGDSFFVTAPFTNAGTIDLAANSAMVVQNSGTLTQTSGVLHLGTSATLTAGLVAIDGGTLLADGPAATITANLLYASSSASSYQGILAGAGNSLTLDNPAALPILSGASNSYTGGTNVLAGTLEVMALVPCPTGRA